MAIRKLLPSLLIFSMALVLAPATAVADHFKKKNAVADELVCPPHPEISKFANEPLIVDRYGRVSRIHNRQTRAVARRACRECGNAIPEPGEQCDTGGESATCDADCTPVACGDGIVNAAASEQCDDGNETSGDGCSAFCQTEVVVGCGNGVLEAGEQCDDGNTDNTDFCTNACQNAACGDSISCTTCGEACDTGGESATCDADCTAVVCGDGIVNAAAGEQCDGGDGCETNCTATFGQCVTSAQCNGPCLHCDTEVCVPEPEGTVCGIGMICTGAGDQCIPG